MQNNIDKSTLQLRKQQFRERIRQLKVMNFEGNESKYYHLSRKMFENVISFNLYIQSSNLGIYASKISSYEIQTDDIINHALSKEKIVYLPRCIVNRTNLEFLRILNLESDTEIATFSIREPKHNLEKMDQSLFIQRINLLFIPGMAFDKFGNRMGYGTGYYDNFINQLRETNEKIFIIGLAFDFQIFSEVIPHDSNDARVDYLISPSNILKIPKK